MTRSHAPLSPITRVLCVLLLAAGLVAQTRAAQPTMPIEQSLEAYNTLEDWVRNWNLPPANTPEARTPPAVAAVVTLRVDGSVFGRGAAASPEPSPMLVWQAANEAITSANAKLTSERDAMWEAFIKQLSSRITITLEIADTLIPVSNNELALPGFGYSPGVMGVAVRRGDRADAIGAESMLSGDTDMAQSARALANALSDGGEMVLRSPKELNESGFTIYRFTPVVLAQPAPGLGAAFTDRGGRVVESSEINMSALREMADNIAEHLMSRRWPGVEDYGLAGTLDPVTGATETDFASPFEQAIGAYALLRYGQDAGTQLERDAFRTGREILRELALVEQQEQAPWSSPVGASMTIIALAELQLQTIVDDDQLNELRRRSLETLDGLYSESGGFAKSAPSAAHGLVTHALVASAQLDPRDRSPLARSAVSRVFLETPPSDLVAQMPFLAWAQLQLIEAEAEIPTRVALRQMRELVWEHQLRRSDLAWVDRDLAGGIVFTSASAPLPSWSALRPLAGIAAMLRDARLTPGSPISGEVPAQIGRLTDSLRFVRQLVAQGEIMHLYAAAEQARWGVRMALWDQRMPVEVDAMALLVLTETLESFEQIARRRQP